MRNERVAWIAGIAAAAAILAAQPALAQEPSADWVGSGVVKKTETSSAKEGQTDGWFPSLTLGASFSFTHMRAVVGQKSGVSLAIGGTFGAGLVFKHGPHEWATDIGWRMGLNRMPDLNAFAKSQDDFWFQTKYMYMFPRPRWLGAFASFRLESAMLAGWQLSAADMEVVVYSDAGHTNEVDRYAVGPGDKVNLTGPFSPLLLKENLGLMAKPVDTKAIRVDINLGMGFHELMIFEGQRIEDDAATPDLDLVKMRGYNQIGVAFETRIVGTPHPIIEYGAGIELLQPVYSSRSGGFTGFELLNIRIDAMLRLRLWKYLSLDFTIDAKHYPLVVDRWQVATNVLLTFHYEYPGAPK